MVIPSYATKSGRNKTIEDIMEGDVRTVLTRMNKAHQARYQGTGTYTQGLPGAKSGAGD